MAEATIHLVCGSTGAGKTTHALRLCRQLGAMHFSADDWMVALFAPDTPQRADWTWGLPSGRRGARARSSRRRSSWAALR